MYFLDLSSSDILAGVQSQHSDQMSHRHGTGETTSINKKIICIIRIDLGFIFSHTGVFNSEQDAVQGPGKFHKMEKRSIIDIKSKKLFQY